MGGVNTRQRSFQERVRMWMAKCFGPKISSDRLERGDRLLEEVLELLQSGGYPRERIKALEAYVYARPEGEPKQEVGGVMVTLAAYCLAFDLNMHDAAETELARIWTKIDAIRAKQATKPVGSALPVAQGVSPNDSENARHGSPQATTGGVSELCEDEGCPHFGTPHICNPVRYWRCFHCDEVFTDESEARAHFGDWDISVPACKIKAGAEGSLLKAYRQAEHDAARAWEAIHNETTDAAKAYYAQNSRHQRAIQAAEEMGFERGMDGQRQEVETLTKERDEARFSPMGDNHHNALACPYCNPKRIDPAAEKARADALALQVKTLTATLDQRGVEAELRECPFCGAPPLLMSTDASTSLICSNDECDIRPDIEVANFDEADHRSAAIARWNRRTFTASPSNAKENTNGTT